MYSVGVYLYEEVATLVLHLCKNKRSKKLNYIRSIVKRYSNVPKVKITGR